MKRYRIAIVTPTCPPRSGGIATAHYNIYRLLRERHDVRVFAYSDDTTSDDPDVVRRCTPKAIKTLFRVLLRTYIALRYRATPPLTYCTRIAELVFGAWRLNRPLRRFDPDVVIVPDNNIPLYILRPPDDAKILWCLHHGYTRFKNNPLLEDSHWLDLDVATSMERRASARAHAFVSPSEYALLHFDSVHGLSGRPGHVIPNFLVPDATAGIPTYPLREDMGLPPDTPIVYIPSAGSHAKGSRYVYEIVRRITEGTKRPVAYFLSGHLPGDLSHELSTLGDAFHIHAPGHLVWRDNVANIRAASLCVSPTLAENFSSAFVEAMWAGIPVVTFDVGGNRELVDEQTGVTVPYLRPDLLADAAIHILNDRDRMEAMSSAARVRAATLFSETHALRSIERLLSEVAGD